MASQVNSTKHTKKSLILLKLLQKIEEERTLPKTFYEASINLILKPEKDTTKKGNYRLMPLINLDAKILNNFFCVCVQDFIFNVVLLPKRTRVPCDRKFEMIQDLLVLRKMLFFIF